METTNKDAVMTDENKTALLEIRGIIDGVLESGSTDYKTALQEIAATANEICFAIPPTKSFVPSGQLCVTH